MDKRIWFDIEEPKTAVMFKSLFKMFQDEGAELLITARDYDSTIQILDDFKINYKQVGKHGGERLEDKLQTYVERLKDLLPIVQDFSPDFFVTFSSVEGTRISYGLRIPSIGFNDEPRNEPVCKLIFPFLNNIITPQCVPIEWYINLYADPKKIIRYNGIDELGWLLDYFPNPQILEDFNLEKGKFVILRTEPSFASYFIDILKPEETLISEIFPPIYKEYPNHKYFLLVRTSKQQLFLQNRLQSYIDDENVVITRYLPNIPDFCFYGALVISGGGTIVRESSLLNVPSIEFFPGETAPQEQFLIKNKFPLEHIRDKTKIIQKAVDILGQKASPNRYDLSFKDKLIQFDNPNKVCFDTVKNNLNK